MKATMRIAIIQMHVHAGDPDKNFAVVAERMEQAAISVPKPDVIILPELWNTGYALDNIAELADEYGQRTKAYFSSFCAKHGIYAIAGSVADKTELGVRNTVYAFDCTGNVVADYAKIHLFRLMEEEKFLTGGDKTGTLDIDGVRAAMMICYDLRFPELARKYALAGAKILFIPAEWPHPRLHHWRTLLMSRAIENQLFVVACNRVGASGGTQFFGCSMVVDPWGEIVAEGGEDEAVIMAELNLELVDRVRALIPVFADRRPELY